MPLTVENISQVETIKTDDRNTLQALAADGTRIRVLAIDDNEEFRTLVAEFD